ncbi:MAG: outer membrane lipoprotein chaperone LolA [Hydrogenophilaceae bacterium]|nr:outer membrane lipoprotein chaperone LolA [Hydrogenophilaceae bacterium]
MKINILFYLLFFASQVHAGGVEALKAFIGDTRTAKSAFSQTVTDQNGKLRQKSEGTLAFSRPGKFRWVYQKPYEQLIVGDGAKLWIYDADLEQVTVKKLGDALGSSPAALLAGSNEIEKYFMLKDAGMEDGMEWLEARPRDKESTFEFVRMGFAGGTLKAMQLKDSFGQTTELKFSKLEKNPQLNTSDFKFTPPKGVDIISE